MSRQLADTRRLSAFYGEMTSVEEVLRGLERGGGKPGKVKAPDLYTRSLDCQNHGGYAMLERIAALAAPYGGVRTGMRYWMRAAAWAGPGASWRIVTAASSPA
jgi:hypothetical protein